MIKKNVAYAEFLISCESDTCLGRVHTGMAEGMPKGDAGLAG